VDRYEGLAHLEWWANRLTCLGAFRVRVLVTAIGTDWLASADFVEPLSAEEHEGWSFLTQLSPYFTLRFEADESAAIDVRVDRSENDRLALSAA
jgi:hypothetical protein